MLKRDNRFATKWYKTGLNDLQQELISATISEIIGEGAFNMGKVMGEIKKNPKFAPKMSIIAKELKNINNADDHG